MSKIWAPVRFFIVKVILIDFQVEKYMQFKLKNVYNLRHYLRHSDVTK